MNMCEQGVRSVPWDGGSKGAVQRLPVGVASHRGAREWGPPGQAGYKDRAVGVCCASNSCI